MKTLLLSACVAGLAVSVLGQGNLNFGNGLGASVFRAPIFGPVSSDDGLGIHGQGAGSFFFPTGTADYLGASPLSGTGYTMALYAGAATITDPNQLVRVYTTTFRTGGAAGFVAATTVSIPGVDAGKSAKFQIRVWDNAGGTITSTAAASDWGVSEMVLSGPLGGTDSNGNIFPINPDSTGWTSFNIYNVAAPEPPGWALLLGGGCVAWVRLLSRRRRIFSGTEWWWNRGPRQH